jgi:hypothetical protein
MPEKKSYRKKSQRLSFDVVSFRDFLCQPVTCSVMNSLGLGKALPKPGSAAGVLKRTRTDNSEEQNQQRKKAHNGADTATGRRLAEAHLSTHIPPNAPRHMLKNPGEWRWCLLCEQGVPRKGAVNNHPVIPLQHNIRLIILESMR